MRVVSSVLLALVLAATANPAVAQSPTAEASDSLAQHRAVLDANQANVGKFFFAGLIGGIGIGSMAIQGWGSDRDRVPQIVSGVGAALVIYSASETVQPLDDLPPEIAAELEREDAAYRESYVRAYGDRLGSRQRSKLALGSLVGGFLGLAFLGMALSGGS